MPAALTAPIRSDDDARAYLEATDRLDSLAIDESGRVVESARCLRCGGTGYGPWFQDGGMCYECYGANTLNSKRRTGVKRYAQAAKRRDRAQARRVEQAAAERAERKTAAERFIDDRPELAAALARHEEHPILSDLSEKLAHFGSLSDAQCALALRLVAQVDERASERKAPVPAGRQELTGNVVKAAWHESAYGTTLKLTVKVETDAGMFLVWGSCPAAIEDAFHARGVFDDGGLAAYARGLRLRFTATVTRSDRDESFGFFKRPSKASVL